VAALDLRGTRVWLSGAVPPEASEAEQDSMRRFITAFANEVFRAGGYIVHGSHPTVVPILIDEVKKHLKEGGRKDRLTLAVSRHWSKHSDVVPVHVWREYCVVNEIPEATGPSARDQSLQLLRQWMADRCDAFIAVGGAWWKTIAGRSGIPLEVGLALQRGIPCFLLGGLGGAASTFVKDHPEVMDALKNGLDVETNSRLATEVRVDTLIHEIIGQLARLPTVAGRTMDGASFRILALDGGGIKGTFTAAALARLEESTGLSIVEHFDLIAGTSTGGILALGLALGMSASEMLQFYRTRGPHIFPMTRFHQRLRRQTRHIFRPKFSQSSLLSELTNAYFPDGKLKFLRDSRCRLVIPAYDAVTGTCHIFRTPHHELLHSDESVSIPEVALATAAAPSYFGSAKVRNIIAKASYFDGGVWANCPAMAAIIEATCYLKISLDRIDVLSVGTTEEPFTVKHLGSAGLLGWRRSIIDLLMNAQMDSSIRHAQLLVGNPHFLRVNAVTPAKMYELDSINEIEDLAVLGDKSASNPDILSNVKSRFLNGVGVLDWRQQ
jgi:uncharacterized protein